MSRPLRIEYEGAWYHVMNRGTGRQRVFRTDSQRRYFLSLLGETAERFNAEWHTYCLMGNHYHLMVRTPEGNLQGSVTRLSRNLNVAGACLRYSAGVHERRCRCT
jgi:REP element-mobilizing transposase RayT